MASSSGVQIISSRGLRSILQELDIDHTSVHSAVIFIIAPGIVDAVFHLYVRDENGMIKGDGKGDVEDRIVVARVDWDL